MAEIRGGVIQPNWAAAPARKIKRTFCPLPRGGGNAQLRSRAIRCGPSRWGCVALWGDCSADDPFDGAAPSLTGR